MNVDLVVGLGFPGGHLTDRFIDGQAKADGKTGLSYDVIAEFTGKFEVAKEAVHTREIDIKLIYRGFLVHGYIFPNNVRHEVGVFAVIRGVTTNYNGFGAELPRHSHGHGRVHPELSSFIAAGCNHPTVACAADDNGFAAQTAVHQALNRDKKGVQIQM